MNPIIVNKNGLHECKRRNCLHHVKPNNCIKEVVWSNEKGKCSLYENNLNETLEYISDIFSTEYPALNTIKIEIDLSHGKPIFKVEYTKKGGNE